MAGLAGVRAEGFPFVGFVVASIAKAPGRGIMLDLLPPVRIGDLFVSMYEVPRALEDARVERTRAAPVNVRVIRVRVDAIDVGAIGEAPGRRSKGVDHSVPGGTV